MPATPTPGAHYRTPLAKRLRVVRVTGELVSGVYVTDAGIDYRPAQEVALSVDFVQRWCAPIPVVAPGQSIGAAVARAFGAAA